MTFIRQPFSILLLFILGSTSSLCHADEQLSATEILERADAIRFPSGDHHLKVSVIFHRPGEQDQTGEYEVLTKGHDRTLIETLAPASGHGDSILMVNRDLWIFVKDVSQPLRISFQQRLLGDVSNGDLARANFVGDYTPKLSKQTDRFYVLDLTAKTPDVTYARVLLVIEKATFHPVKAQFFAISGKLLKTGAYEDFKPIAGALRPTRLVFDNPLVKGQKSTIIFHEITSEPIPDKYFTKDYLKKLKY